ncbi:hypothetical protein EDD37DRAFT_648115 [Exophiala viscosa]|uniref:Glutaredoxin domain-containing protein n=1 Tax=Exophiala viscosa TaxID=2486360 RepID=A0AAN6ICA7_9EURO|nr:hypothetical protein EDD36DRAFT_464739 [Exophiala viscosa]KAI1625651.1 hypothetical protein EDD37DRAFT_648115 [Exophiala viscosa]
MAATSYSTDPTLYLYTSLTAGSSHIITATSRLETILKANKIPFRALDCATDEKARMLWGRRSKGRKLPGLVKAGTIIGDLEQIEEWNEYGELKEQIAAADTGVSMTSTPSNLTAEPPHVRPTASTTSSGPPSRASSETRHILISDPKDKESESAEKPSEPPLNVAMRQLGAEAAAKAGQKKAATAQAAKAPTKPPDNTETTPVPATTKLSPDVAVESPETATEVTAAKTPAQLASEGAKKTSVDKIAEVEGTATTETESSSSSPSTEAQLVEQRRQSSITKQKSRLSESTPLEHSESVLEEEDKKEEEMAVPASEVSADPPMDMPKQHRGSDVGTASAEEIKAVEKEMRIPESAEEHEVPTTTEEKGVTSTDEAEAQASVPHEEGAKDADKAGVSLGD